MESILIWIITAALISGIVLPYYLTFRKRQKHDMERRREAQLLGLDKPKGQFPMIDMALCIGCGSCVAVCPEGDVLGIVFGRATIINGLRCVGHGYCEKACPVGALKVGLGDIKTRADIPLMNEHNETTVPGIYIAGELGGLSLIRNAIDQGCMVIQRIVELEARATDPAIYDVIIVGAGPAGITAALAATKFNLRYKALDRQDPGGTILQYPRQKLVMTQPVDIPLHGQLKKEEYSKEFLLELWREIIVKHKLNINCGERVERVTKNGEIFDVTTIKGSYRARNIVLAMGRRGTPRKLGVPGEELPKTLYQLVDAQSYQNRHLLVVGGGDSAVEAAVGLGRQTGNKVTISYRQSKFAKVKLKNEQRINELIAEKKIRPLFNSNVLEIREKTVLIKAGEDTIEIPNDFVFIFAGGEPPFKMLAEMGVAFGGEAKPIKPQDAPAPR
jgi:putative YpdA family bacillithiol system oxidoreductase